MGVFNRAIEEFGEDNYYARYIKNVERETVDNVDSKVVVLRSIFLEEVARLEKQKKIKIFLLKTLALVLSSAMLYLMARHY